MRNAAPAWSTFLLRGVLAGFALFLVAASPARAADIYRVLGVEVDAEAESAVAAREQAIARGQREGLVRLMQRLTSPEDHGRLPAVEGISIEPFVASYEIARERVGSTRYLATLNVSYVAAAVQGLLDANGFSFVTRRSEPILVVPLEVTEAGPASWLDPSPWRTAWYDALETATVAVLALPLADLADVAAAPPEVLQTGDRAALGALAARYGTERVVVTTARLQRAPETNALARVEVAARRPDAWGEPLIEEVVTAAPEEPEADTLARAAGLVVAAIEDDWKRETLVSLDALSSLTAAVPLADLAGWVQVRDQLERLREVRSLQLVSLNQSQARVAIGHAGDLGELAAALGRVGLALTEESDGWHLRPAVGPAALPVLLPALPGAP